MQTFYLEPAAVWPAARGSPAGSGKDRKPEAISGPPFKEVLKEKVQSRAPDEDEPEEACPPAAKRAEAQAVACPTHLVPVQEQPPMGEPAPTQGRVSAVQNPAGRSPDGVLPAAAGMEAGGMVLLPSSEGEAAQLPAPEPGPEWKEGIGLTGGPAPGLSGSRMAAGLAEVFDHFQEEEGQLISHKDVWNEARAGRAAPEPAESGSGSPPAGAQIYEPARQAEAQNPGDKYRGSEPGAPAPALGKSAPAGQAPAGTELAGVQAAKVEGLALDGARPPEGQAGEVARQVARGIESLARAGQAEFGKTGSGPLALRMQLYPEKLGRIDLRLSAGVDGMQVTILAGQQNTGQLLENNLHDLRQALSEAGIHVNSLSVGVSGGEAQSQAGHARQQQSAGAGRGAAAFRPEEAGTGPERDMSQRARAGSATLVDYQV